MSTIDGKPTPKVGDSVSVVAAVTSVSGTNLTAKLTNSGNSITSAISNFNGPTASGAGRTTPASGDQVTGRGTVSALGTDTGFTTSMTVTVPDLTTITVNAGDVYGVQTA